MAHRFRRGIRDGLWKAALCADASTTAGLIRESLDELGYKYTRDMAHKPFTKFMAAHEFRPMECPEWLWTTVCTPWFLDNSWKPASQSRMRSTSSQ